MHRDNGPLQVSSPGSFDERESAPRDHSRFDSRPARWPAKVSDKRPDWRSSRYVASSEREEHVTLRCLEPRLELVGKINRSTMTVRVLSKEQFYVLEESPCLRFQAAVVRPDHLHDPIIERSKWSSPRQIVANPVLHLQ